MNIEELYNILLDSKPSQRLLENEDKIFDFIPELRLCKGFNQNNEWHVYDVYEHILHVVDNVECDIVLRLAALFHDVGKPFCYSIDANGVGHFYGHYEVSKRIFDKFADRNGIVFDLKSVVSNLIFYHDINISRLSNNKIDELYKIFGCAGIKKLYKLKRADLLAQNSKFHYILNEYDEQEKKLLLKFD